MKMFVQNQKRKFLTLDNDLDNYDDIKNNKYTAEVQGVQRNMTFCSFFNSNIF